MYRCHFRRVVISMSRIILKFVGVAGALVPLTPKRHVTFDISNTMSHGYKEIIILNLQYKKNPCNCA